mgnify:FL=1
MTTEQQIWQWLDQVVIGLNLCPFAKKPRANQQIRLVLNESRKNKALLQAFEQELHYLMATPAEHTDTTLFAITHHLYDFYDYLDFLDLAQTRLEQGGFEGQLQLASFHPDYVFDGTEFEDRENFTNRAPVPIIHIIREDSMAKVLAKYPNPEAIPENNIQCMEKLSKEQLSRMFPTQTWHEKDS